MQLQLPLVLPDDIPGVLCTFMGVVVAIILLPELSNCRKLSRILTLGPNSLFLSWLNSRRFNGNVYELVQEGYKKYTSKGLPFKIANSYRWLVLVGSPKHIHEFKKAPEDAFSLTDPADEFFRIVEPEVISNPYQTIVIRDQLTRNIGNLFTEVLDDKFRWLSMTTYIWGIMAVHAMKVIQNIVCRANNRVFVGLPLCRDLDWVNINLRYALDVVKASNQIKRLPGILVPLVLRFTTDIPNVKERARKHLAPIIEERLKFLEEHRNDLDGKPADLLSWLMDKAPEGPERTVRLLTERLLLVNFAAIHSTSNTFVSTLFLLAENPQYVEPLREEVEAIIEKEGWSKASLAKMCKIDSFIKESLRLVGSDSFGLARMAMKDFVFSDGTLVPKGALMAMTTASLHRDDEYYEDAHAFKPFRFSDMREEDGEGTKHHFVSTSLQHLTFGHGRHACPGRFFAANTLKTMLAYVVVTYDIKLEDGKPRPQGIHGPPSVGADPFANVMFRKRIH